MNFSAAHYDDRLDLNDIGYLRRNDLTDFWLQTEYRRYDYDWARKVYLNGCKLCIQWSGREDQ